MKRYPIVQPLWHLHCHRGDGGVASDLSPALQSRVMEHAAATIDLRKGETLAHTGAPFRHLYLVTRGTFKSVQLGEDGRSQIVCFHWAHEFMGLSGFARHVQTTDLVALTTPSVVCEFPVNGQDAPAQVHPTLLGHLLGQVSESLVQAEHDQFMLGSLSATQKIACFFLRTQDKLLRAGLNPDVFELPMTREEIGSYLGLTMETVSRLLSHLHTQGVMEVDRKRVRILRDDVLRAWWDEGVGFPEQRASPALNVA